MNPDHPTRPLPRKAAADAAVSRVLQLALQHTLVVAPLLLLSQAHAANLLFNPGFEEPGSIGSNCCSNLTSLTIPGWVLYGAGGVGYHEASVRAETGVFSALGHVGRMEGNASITTSAAYRPAATPGQEYLYAFSVYNQSSGVASNNVQLVWFNASGNSIGSNNLIPAGQALLAGEKRDLSGTIVAPANTASVAFQAFATYSPYRTIWVDNFSLAPVPEPGTYAMLLAGLGVIGAVARRRGTGR